MKHTTITAVILALASISLLGCPGDPPTDALDAASAAINRALDGYAEDCAPEEYRAAVRLFEDAERANAAGDYEEARNLAEAAREQAERARLTAQANLDDCEAAAHLFDDGTEDDDNVFGRPDLSFANYELVPVYFGYDSDGLDNQSRDVLQLHAEFINQDSFQVIIEGHCDQHGTDMYNLALGERRARTVAQYLVTMGVDPSRLAIISYGEFRPSSDHDESLNRRAEFRAR